MRAPAGPPSRVVDLTVRRGRNRWSGSASRAGHRAGRHRAAHAGALLSDVLVVLLFASLIGGAMVVLWPMVLVLIFLPLAVHTYRGRDRWRRDSTPRSRRTYRLHRAGAGTRPVSSSSARSSASSRTASCSGPQTSG
ncbi:hypothetical protein FB471_6542 [Amycolatopsis cihanbeyliensis]|uniref:Uncharacterized protein n=1 Tax=Amycolatopsis cihanbeyliensis TaxID=1128664 RepID=A0A542CU83_AMYCI|nr:hypothetical protein FB471_6542 [Amycolatopsis cihanbeyliensis]